MREIKFIIDNIRSRQIIKWLQCSCVPDPEFPSGTVSSIYYDTKDWRFLGEKVNSDYLKTKVRVRWYSDISNVKCYDAAFVEAKFKTGGRREKVRTRTEHSGEWFSKINLDNPKLLEIPFLLGVKGIVLNIAIYPAYQISYKRLRFIDPYTGSRICIDYDILVPRVNIIMLPRSNPFKLRTAVFEIKGEREQLPYNLKPLIDLGCRKASFSKYSECYKKIMNSNF